MNTGIVRLFVAALALAFVLLAASAQNQSIPIGAGSGTNFLNVMYFEPPYEEMVKVRFLGAQMSPLPGAKFDIRQLRIEKFYVNGNLEAVAEAPQCIYALSNAVANSAGPLVLDLNEGKIHVRGQGFLWKQNESLLIISNQQHTVVKMGTWKLTTP